ncbi:hypothetical protein ACFQ5N_10245 [Lutibacter holmesii]|uniref:Uncharacterized protein n=1 Tax=Lutibacter holmesii TaxID=1137985 RepID=A0ABW3WSC0_9FLAO
MRKTTAYFSFLYEYKKCGTVSIQRTKWPECENISVENSSEEKDYMLSCETFY